MKRAPDLLTKDLFEVPAPRAALPGALDVGVVLRHLLSDLMKGSPRSRFEIASRMSELLGDEVSKHQLDSWTAESREGWRFPLEYVPAFEVAVETHALTAWLAELRGCTVLIGKDALLAELGKLERTKQELQNREKTLKRLLGEERS